MDNTEKESQDPESKDNSSPTCKIPLQQDETAGDGGHGNETDKLQQASPSLSTKEIIKSSPPQSGDSLDKGNDDYSTELNDSYKKQDFCVVPVEIEDNKNHGNNKSPSSPGKIRVVSAEITPEPQQSPVATSGVGSHINKDVDVCVVTKEGVTKQDEIKYIDESPVGSDTKDPAVCRDSQEDIIVKDVGENKPDCKPKDTEQKYIFGKLAKDKDKPMSKEIKTPVSNGSSKSKSKVKENKEHDINMNSSRRIEKEVPSETDKLLNGAVTTKAVVVVEDMSNVDEKMPITKL